MKAKKSVVNNISGATTITNTEINHHSTPSPRKIDDSALHQGRKPIGLRTVGVKVEPKHMTPKEHRNFKAGIWSGIETRPYIQSWESHAFERVVVEDKPVRFVNKKPQVLERRQDDRRIKSKRTLDTERRNDQRRHKDKLDYIAYYSCLSFSFIVLISLTIAVIVFNVDWNA